MYQTSVFTRFNILQRYEIPAAGNFLPTTGTDKLCFIC